MLLELDSGRLEVAIWPAGGMLLLAQVGGREVCGLVGGFHGVPGPGQTPNSCTRIRLWLRWANSLMLAQMALLSSAGAGAEARSGLE